MKRFIIAGIVIVGIGIIILGNLTWNQKVEKTVQKAEEKISSPIYKESLPEGEAEDTSTTDGKNTNTKSTSSEPSKKPGETESTTETKAEDEPGSTPTSDGKPSLEEIKAEYHSIFSELEAQETSKVDQLLVQAKADLVSNKASVAELVAKYEEAANFMEQNADRTFNTIYAQLEYDLERYGYSKNEATSFRQTYNAKKQERYSRVLSQMQ